MSGNRSAHRQAPEDLMTLKLSRFARALLHATNRLL
jgi:hypothetical protein